MQKSLLAVPIGTLFLVACGSTPEQPATPVAVRVATPFAKGHLLEETAQRFKQELEARGKHFTVTVEAGVLNEQTINPAMLPCERAQRVGEIMLTGGQPIQDYAPKYFFFNGPYVIRDFKHLQAVWGSEIGHKMRADIAAKGYVVFEPVYRGYRQFTSNKVIQSPADFQKLKLRLPPTPDWNAVWSSLGVTAVTVPLPGIYDALKNGVAEASEGDLTQIQSLKLHEVQSKLTLTNHLVGFGMPMANACFFNKELTERDRKLVSEAMQAAAKWGSDTFSSREASILGQLRSAGMTVSTPDAAAIRKAAEPAINKLFASNWTVTTWQEVLAK